MEGFQFREAVAEDKEEILDIDRNVYSGGDYLEKVYDEWAVQVTKSYHSKFYVHVILRPHPKKLKILAENFCIL